MSRRIDEREEGERLLRDARSMGEALVKDYVEKVEEVRRPLPLRTDDLLRDLHKLTGIPASQLLRIAEELYSEGYISYPRTETNRWPRDFDFRSPAEAAVSGGLAAREVLEREPKPLEGRKDDKAHPPIYPLKPYPRDGSRRWKVWEYVARRFLANVFWRDAEIVKQRVSIMLGNLPLNALGGRVTEEGFYEVYPYFRPRVSALPRLRKGESLRVVDVRLVEEWTKPPSRLTEAELLRLMERDGIGTDATRADYPKMIVDRGYAFRVRKTLKPTELGMTLVKSLREVDERLVSPATRRLVEEYMERIAAGEKEYGEALDETLKLYSELYRRLEDRAGALAENLARSASEVRRNDLQGQKGRRAQARGASNRGPT